MTQLTLRKIPVAVSRRLRQCARQDGQSLNRTAIVLLTRALGLEQPPPTKRKRDLSRFVGTLSAEQEREFQANTKAFEAIDKELWQ